MVEKVERDGIPWKEEMPMKSGLPLWATGAQSCCEAVENASV